MQKQSLNGAEARQSRQCQGRRLNDSCHTEGPSSASLWLRRLGREDHHHVLCLYGYVLLCLCSFLNCIISYWTKFFLNRKSIHCGHIYFQKIISILCVLFRMNCCQENSSKRKEIWKDVGQSQASFRINVSVFCFLFLIYTSIPF